MLTTCSLAAGGDRYECGLLSSAYFRSRVQVDGPSCILSYSSSRNCMDMDCCGMMQYTFMFSKPTWCGRWLRVHVGLAFCTLRVRDRDRPTKYRPNPGPVIKIYMSVELEGAHGPNRGPDCRDGHACCLCVLTRVKKYDRLS